MTGRSSMARATRFVVHVENTLGWVVPQPYGGLATNRQREAKKIRDLVDSDPRLTWEKLDLAVEYLRRKHLVRAPLGVAKYVDAAVELAAEPVQQTPIGDEIQAAVAWEMNQDEPDLEWVGQLGRAVGEYRVEALREWQKERRS